MRTFIAALLLLFTFSLHAQNTTGADSLTTFTKGKYSIRHPEKWVVDTSKRFGLDVIILSPRTDSLDNFSESMSVFVQDLTDQSYDLAKMGKESEESIKNMVNDLQIIESRLDSSASLQSYILKFKGKQGKFTLISSQRYFLKDRVGYALTMTIQEGKETEYAALEEQMFRSFRLN